MLPCSPASYVPVIFSSKIVSPLRAGTSLHLHPLLSTTLTWLVCQPSRVSVFYDVKFFCLLGSRSGLPSSKSPYPCQKMPGQPVCLFSLFWAVGPLRPRSLLSPRYVTVQRLSLRSLYLHFTFIFLAPSRALKSISLCDPCA